MVFFLPYPSGGVCRAVSLLFSIAHPGERCKQKMEQRRFSLPILGLTALPCGVILYRFQKISVPKNGTDVKIQEYFL